MVQHQSAAHPLPPHHPRAGRPGRATGPAMPGPHRRRRFPPPPKTSALSRFIVWEWFFVLALLGGLGSALWLMSAPVDPKRQAADLVAQMKSAAIGKPLGPAVFGSYPTAQRFKREAIVTIDKIPPKVCVMASWDLYRFGVVSVNGVTPNRVSAARLVELCNENETATLTWTVKLFN